tara:strand:- start:495 stop:665 length:171 start_codon:yes stop_codon:yes gene_type:complete
MLGICWEKYIFDVGKKIWAKKDPNWVKVRVEKIHYGKVGTVRISHYYLGHFSELLF